MIDKIVCEGCENCDKISPLFSLLSIDELKIINSDRHTVQFRAGEVIVKQGTTAISIISVIEGFARLYVEGHGGRKLILDYIKPWQMIGEPWGHTSGKYSYSVAAIKDTLVCFLNVDRFIEVIGLNGEFAKAYVKASSLRHDNSLKRMVSLGQKQMHGRVADNLIYLKDVVFESTLIGREVSRQDIADYTGMSKDSAIRILKEFERDQIIRLNGKGIEILDGSQLQSISVNGRS